MKFNNLSLKLNLWGYYLFQRDLNLFSHSSRFRSFLINLINFCAFVFDDNNLHNDVWSLCNDSQHLCFNSNVLAFLNLYFLAAFALFARFLAKSWSVSLFILYSNQICIIHIKSSEKYLLWYEPNCFVFFLICFRLGILVYNDVVWSLFGLWINTSNVVACKLGALLN